MWARPDVGKAVFAEQPGPGLIQLLFHRLDRHTQASLGLLHLIVVDCTSISSEVSAEIREKLAERGIQFIAAPVSGNGKCVKTGKLSVVASGPKDAFDTVEPYLEIIGGAGVSYVGDGDESRIVKICHNVFLGVVTQSLAELTILAKKSGVPRHAFLDFINKSVMGWCSVDTKLRRS